MMKKLVVGVLALMLAATVIFAGAKRINKFNGQATITLTTNDSTGFVSTNKIQITNANSNQQFDAMIGSVVMTNMDEVGSDSTVDNEGEVDTLIVRYYFGTDWYSYLAEVDTVTLPGTTFVQLRRDLWADPDRQNDSAAVIPDLTGDNQALMQTHFWMDYYVMDTAGTQDSTMTGTLQWFWQFYETGEE